jgi:hypothetical protein
MKQITFSLPQDLAEQVSAERERIQQSMGIRVSQSQILSGLIRRALEAVPQNDFQPSRAG